MVENKRIIGWLELTLLQIIEEYKGGLDEPLDGDDTERLSDIIKAKIDLQEGNITESEYAAIIDNTASNSDIKYIYIDLNVREGERTHNHRVLIETTDFDIDRVVDNYACDYWGNSEKDENGSYYACGGEINIEVHDYKELNKETYDIMFNVMYK